MRYILRALAAAALVYAGIVHLHLAATYDGGEFLSIGHQFRAQFAASLVAAVILLVPRRWAWWPAIVVAGATLLAVLASVYLTVGPIGPLPALPSEPWYDEKAFSAVAEAAVVVLGVWGYRSGRRRRGRQRRPDSEQSKPFAADSA
ncbi:MAG: hypothetical protein DLM59_08945 [Pseudonocardiales bacterium]|nr:MAG: hypothetical protein DLM59_08945 [Pseudonocardiales bacterium]